MYRDHTVAIAVPAYNEEGYVGEVIDAVPDYADRVYVVDDGSTDGTWSEIRRHAERRNARHDPSEDSEGAFDRLVVPIQHDENRGVGGAIKTAYLRAREERIDVTAVLGGDNQMDPDELTRYLDPVVDGVADYTKGNRFARPEDRAGMPRFRLLGNLLLSWLTKLASGYWGSMDSQNGYTAISLAALERTDVEGMYEYYGYCNDLLVRLNEADIRIADVPRSAEYAYSGEWKSHIDYGEYVPRVSLMLLRGFLRRLRGTYLHDGSYPVPAGYLLGSALVGQGLLGLLTSLREQGDSVDRWLRRVLAGVVCWMLAVDLDAAANRHLEAHLDAGDVDSESHEERAADREAQATTAPHTGAHVERNGDRPELTDSVTTRED
ncbi:glycosyltransferase family 2 protein [Salinirubellus salinus]|uniref:Glycosyltransferase family 2 protein n=1 Tax=Salinirubellus salinus TaxID=1364945 RepID=A0A9E7R454_9EURY|nr:glycosyltransferase family 2 protein [Salinirubellus salinus]UWM54325.1 glycosyltransferase family 2 protein [Salinirubellus salinus]